MEQDADLLVWREGVAGRLRLNRPQALNALTHDMALGIEKALLEWRDDDAVKLVIIDAAGDKAFCAGGDIQQLYALGKAGDYDPARKFWAEEYRLNALIANYPKPYVAIMDGITMGGGVGVGAHGSHRIVTERTMLAMPEVGIGFLPDVGGTWLLSRAPGKTGYYLGMTGARMDAADAIYAGFADTYMESGKLDAFAAKLAESADVVPVIAEFATRPPESQLAAARTGINDAFGQSGPVAIANRLEIMTNAGSDWAAAALAPAHSLGDVDRLAERVGVPDGASARREVHQRGRRPRGRGRGGDGVDVDVAGEPLGGSGHRRRRASRDLHNVLLRTGDPPGRRTLQAQMAGSRAARKRSAIEN